MKNSRFTVGQIVKALKEEENGRSVNDISRELGILSLKWDWTQ
jgi:putative transposase